MHCKHCGFANGEDDHRCLRCGRRIGVAIAAPTGYVGANALAWAPKVDLPPVETPPVPAPVLAAAPAQASLFHPPAGAAPHAKIIPFDQIGRMKNTHSSAGESSPSAAPDATPLAFPKPAPARTASPRRSSTRNADSAEQTRIDFIPAAAAKPRSSKDHVEAVIFCDQQVALPMHRFVAACIDAALILLAFGLFLTIFLGLGGNFGEGKMFWVVMAASFAFVCLFYGSIWGLTGRETPGMQSVGLELITFDGFPVEGQARLLRYFATALSFCSAGLGLLWSLVDEESLSWQDHISKTFPAVREVPRNFVRR